MQLYPNIAEDYVNEKYTSKGLGSNIDKHKQYYDDKQYDPKHSAITLNPYSTSIDEIKRILPHEMKHQWTAGLADNRVDMYGHFIDNPDITHQSSFLKGKTWNDGKYDPHVGYYQRPTEYDAHVNTNFRQDLVDAGVLKDHFDDLTVDKLDKFIKDNPSNHVVKNYFDKGLIGNKENMVKMFNKALPAVAPIGVGAAALSQDNKQYGGKLV